ncbi:hypothetical protein Vadar_014285 [Vaccinium darrowii]|uniref:Uncharacterized protein n=1 Tax=Vaccinium darrowii TaxID=229202 RepID=A0ACB7XQJ6_9ERIC|nr:hypothetical protein Vadar_014285 [Vaccinium darrowii]
MGPIDVTQLATGLSVLAGAGFTQVEGVRAATGQAASPASVLAGPMATSGVVLPQDRVAWRVVAAVGWVRVGQFRPRSLFVVLQV